MKKTLFSIQGKIVIITGATGYLGLQMVKDLNQKGAKIIILSTSLNKALNLCYELDIDKKQAYEIDISSLESINKTIKQVYKTFGKIDVLINNAYYGVSKKFNKYTKDDWCKGLEGTIISLDFVTKAVLKYMKKHQKGRIINISSMYGIVSPNPNVYLNKKDINPLVYGIGKAAIIQYTKYVAMLVAKYNITVNSVSYGPFPNINVVKNKIFLTNLSKQTFLNRIGRKEEVTSVLFFLSLDESSYITGQNIVVDGGWTSW